MRLSTDTLRRETSVALHGAAQAPGARPLGRAAPAPRGRAGRAGRPLRLHRAGPGCDGRGAAPRPGRAAGRRPIRSWSTPRCRSTRSSTPPPPTTTTSATHHLPGTPAQLRNARRRAGRQGLLAGAARDTGVRGALRAGRVVPLRGAGGASPTCSSTPPSDSVVLATPTTLIALLRTVAHGWPTSALADQAHEVQRLGRELHERLATMGGHLDPARPFPRAPRSAPTTRRWARSRAGCS